MTLETIVLMVITGLVAQSDRTLKETWRIEKMVPISQCLQMNRISSSGRYGAVLVRCDPVVP